MVRTITVVLALICLAWLSAPGLAQQSTSDCDKWLAKINTEAGIRADEASHAARMKVEEIAKICKDGKTAEAEKGRQGNDGDARHQALAWLVGRALRSASGASVIRSLE